MAAPITATANAITLMKGAIATMNDTQLIKAVVLAVAGLMAAGATLAYSPAVAIDDPPAAATRRQRG